MTRKMTGLIAAGSLAIGIVLGGAGAIVARDDATPDMANHMQGMTSMMSMMGAGSRDGMGSMMGADHMADVASMMSMMGAGSPMTPDASMGPDASMSPDEHKSHHVSPSPEATR
jgi:hypothetical protein